MKGKAATPPMGWNSWNMFGVKVNEENIRSAADALVSTGLKDLGYEYVVIDDCWSVKEGRDKIGNLVPDPEKFPSGMKALTEYVHSKGLKIGIYSDAADKTCAGYPGSYGHEEKDAALWASWGFDFLKYDYCNAPWDQATAIDRYTRMGTALQNCGRDILFSLCEWGGRNPHLWGKQAGGSMWRVSADLFDSWTDVCIPLENGSVWTAIGIDGSLEVAARLASYGGPGGWNDLDMLVVGLKGKGQIEGAGLTPVEYRTHMSIWSIACSPLMIGCDITHMDDDTRDILLNRECIAVNQDPLGIPGKRVLQRDNCDYWTKGLEDGSVAAAIVNRGAQGTVCKITAGDLGLLDKKKSVYDIWARSQAGEFTEEYSFRIDPHETRFFIIS